MEMAGAEGFEPTNAGIKTPCLTAWRRPNGREDFTETKTDLQAMRRRTFGVRHERFHRSSPPSLSGQAGLLWKMRLGVTDGVRTRDNRNHNPALYQLSYGHPQTHWDEKEKPALARPAWRAFTGILAFRPKPWRSLSPVVELFRKAVRTASRRHPLLPPRFRPVPGANHLPGQSHVTNLSLPLERMRHPQRGSRRL